VRDCDLQAAVKFCSEIPLTLITDSDEYLEVTDCAPRMESNLPKRPTLKN
jgi:hypothetical protein